MHYLLHTINIVTGDSEALFLSVLFCTLLMVYVAVPDSNMQYYKRITEFDAL